jgi:BolA protein
MSIQAGIEEKLHQQIKPSHLEVINESGNHNVPPGSESHFKVVIVSDAFEGKNSVSRHRMINKVLADELKNKIHALALHTYTDKEWYDQNGYAPQSPPCLGGSKTSA